MSSPHPALSHPTTARLIATLVVLPAVICSGVTQGETWTSLRGTHSVEAEMIGLWDGNVVLQLSGGKRVSVPLDSLRSESRIQAQQLAVGIDSSRGDRVKELQGQAVAAAAPAPNPLPQPAAARPYSAPQKDAKPGEFLQQLDSAVMDGHIMAIFDALPPSYRKDVNEIIKLSTQKTNPETWQALVGTLQQVGDLIVTRQRWFLSSPRIQALPPENLDKIEGQVLTFAGLLRDGLQPEALQLEKLQTMDFGQWLAERDQAIAPHLAQLFEQFGASIQREITVESEKAGTAVVAIAMDGKESKVTYMSVEGYWVPKTIADQWTESVESWKSELAEAPAGSVLEEYALILQPIAPMLDPLTQAGDAGQFHEAMEAIFVPAETIATTVATMLGKSMNLASRGGDSRGGYGDMGYDDGSGYGDDEMGYGDEEMGYDDAGYGDEEMEMEMQMDMEEEMRNQ